MPNAPKTQAFIYNVQSYACEVASRDFDYVEMLGGVENFCYSHAVDKKTANKLRLLTEEMVLNIVMPTYGACTLNLSFSERQQTYEVAVTYGGEKAGVFGIATPETVDASDPRIIAGLTFEDPVQTAVAMVSELAAEDCDVVVALTHLGMDDLSEPSNRSDELAKVDRIDVIIDGHSHTKLDEGMRVGDALIAQTGEYGENVGIVEVTVQGDEVTTTAKLVAMPEEDAEGEYTEKGAEESPSLRADEAILERIDELDAANEDLTSEVVGNTPVLLEGDKEVVRTQETNLANLISDSMRWATDAEALVDYLQTNPSIEAQPEGRMRVLDASDTAKLGSRATVAIILTTSLLAAISICLFVMAQRRKNGRK